MRKLKNWAILVLGILPKSKVKNALLKIFGFKISNHVKIGINIFWNNGPITLGSESSIGNFNIFRNLKSMKLGSESRIGNFNWCTSNLEDLNATKACLILADGSIITSRHYIDCAGGVFLQENSGLLGVRSTVMTHGVDPKNRKQTYSTTIIGRNTLIGSNSVVVPNTILPENSYFAMGSLIAGDRFPADSAINSPKSSIYRKIS